jgi:large subunit ribosomal protein L10
MHKSPLGGFTMALLIEGKKQIVAEVSEVA